MFNDPRYLRFTMLRSLSRVFFGDLRSAVKLQPCGAAPAISHQYEPNHITTQHRSLSLTAQLAINFKPPGNWLRYNEIVFPPKSEHDDQRPAEVYHQRSHAKCDYDKMWYICTMIRGMSVDEAKKQLSFKNRETAILMKEILEEAQKKAVDDHNVEYKSNLWVAEAFPRHAGFIKGRRKHRGSRFGIVRYQYTHVFVKLREGPPPELYYPEFPDGNQLKAMYIERLRKRRILASL